MPDSRIHILSTKNLHADIIKSAEEAGIEIEQLPFIETVAVESNGLKRLIEQLSEKEINAVVTSSRAAEILASLLSGKQPAWKFYCTAPLTKKRIQELFPKGTIVITAENSEVLGQKILETGDDEFVFFCGALHREELPLILKKNGRKLKEVLVYKTELVHHQVARQFDGILFFSPSAVDSFFHSNKLAKEVVLFAIGPTTAAAIKTHGNHELLIAEETSAESLLKKVIERYFGKQAH